LTRDASASQERILVTGGAGFIGSHLIEKLVLERVKIRVIDDLSNGSLENIAPWLKNPNFTFVKGNLLNPADVTQALKGCQIVYHFAANPEVRVGSIRPDLLYQQNIVATYNLLEAIRNVGKIEKLVFASSSTVYGEASKLPTPENYAPMEPISVYGASKLACEAMLMAYAHSYGFNVIIYRPANIVGTRNKQGAVHDFIQKLMKNPGELEILGDGTQTKSYLHISDCIKALLLGVEKSDRQVEVFNVGSENQIDVKTVAEIVTEEMGLENVHFKVTGGVEGGRGWKGDVKNMLLDISKLNSIGWAPEFNSQKSVRLATKQILSMVSPTAPLLKA